MTGLKGLRVLLTGGTGSTAPTVVSRLLRAGVREVRVLSRDRARQRAFAARLGRPRRVTFALGDILAAGDLRRATRGVDIVLHAAAVRDLVAAERDPGEAAEVNLSGTRNVLAAARAAGVRRALVYSSDKAVNPTSVMGATKLVAERLAVAAHERDGLCAAAVRFGVVFTSPGSVLLRGVERVRADRALTLTDPRMSRYGLFPEAVAAGVVEALRRMRGGEVFVVKMIPFRVRDLLRAIAAEIAPRCGRDPRRVRIEVTGARPGEQYDQAMLTPEEAAAARETPRLFVIEPPSRRRRRARPLPASSYRSSFAAGLSVARLRGLIRGMG